MNHKKRNFLCVLLAIVMMLSLAACGTAKDAEPDDPLYIKQTYLDAIGVSSAWQANITGKNVKIALIDTGVAAHDDLDATRIEGKSYTNADETDYTDVIGHGTFVAGILAATSNNGKGIAGMTKSKLVCLQICDASGAVSVQDMAQAILDAVDVYECDVVHISFGTPNDEPELSQAVQHAIDQGAIVVAAAGGDQNTPYYPAAYPDVVGVNTLTQDLEPLETAANNESVFVSAPGEGLVGLDVNNVYQYNGEGTAYAAAQVTAFAAFAKQKHPDMTAQQFAQLLQQSATDLGASGYDTLYGWGVINTISFCDALKQL